MGDIRTVELRREMAVKYTRHRGDSWSIEHHVMLSKKAPNLRVMNCLFLECPINIFSDCDWAQVSETSDIQRLPHNAIHSTIHTHKHLFFCSRPQSREHLPKFMCFLVMSHCCLLPFGDYVSYQVLSHLDIFQKSHCASVLQSSIWDLGTVLFTWVLDTVGKYPQMKGCYGQWIITWQPRRPQQKRTLTSQPLVTWLR